MAREELLSREQLTLLRRLVRELYVRLGSQQQVAATTGLAQQTISKILNGRHPIGINVATRFATTTGLIDLQEFLAGRLESAALTDHRRGKRVSGVHARTDDSWSRNAIDLLVAKGYEPREVWRAVGEVVFGDYPHNNDARLVSRFAETMLHGSGVRPRRLASREHVETKLRQGRGRKR